MPAADLRDVAVHFGAFEALTGVSLSVRKGEFLTLLGPSGCGKSTLLRAISDLVPASGDISIFGASPKVARRSRQFAFVFQDAALLPWRTVLENVRLPLEIGKKLGQLAHRPSSSPEYFIELVGLRGWEMALPHELSGGMRQRASIARALVSNPSLLLMDEPFGALDEITRDRLNEQILRIWRETGTTILFVTHSIAEAVFLGQRVLVMASRPGRIREIVEINLGADRDLAIRDAPEFVALSARMRQYLYEGTSDDSLD